MAASFGRVPRHWSGLISALRRSRGLVGAICAGGKHVVLGGAHQNGELGSAF